METQEIVRKFLDNAAEGTLSLSHDDTAKLIIALVKSETQLAIVKEDVKTAKTVVYGPGGCEGHA